MMGDKGRLLAVGLGTNFFNSAECHESRYVFLMSQKSKKETSRCNVSLIFHIYIFGNRENKRDVYPVYFLK